MSAPDIVVYASVVEIQGTSFRLNWEPPSTDGFPPATSYEVSASPFLGRDPIFTVNAPTTTYLFTGLTPDTFHYVYVRALNGTDGSEWSLVEATTAKVPDIVLNVQLSQLRPGSFRLNWVAPSTSGGNPEATGYQISLSESGEYLDLIDLDEETLAYAFKALKADTLYYVGIRALNGTDYGPWVTTEVTTPEDTGSRPRYAEFIWLKVITDRWVAKENVDGNDTEQDINDGGGPNG